eukprot:2522304-Prymnesium_polylepis.1
MKLDSIISMRGNTTSRIRISPGGARWRKWFMKRKTQSVGEAGIGEEVTHGGAIPSPPRKL